ncbi:MAG: PepSY-associated TM helix domain-containing protein, partial [Planctomycetota bacterium]
MEEGARKKPEGRGTPNQSSKPPKPKSFRRALYRKSAAAFRWLHIYLSMVGFAAMMFFALTGITLNHPTWLGGSEQTVEDFAGELEIDVLEGEVDRLEIAETLRERHQLKGRVKEFEVDEYECMIVYKSPGYAADAFVDRASGRYGVTVTSSNAIAVMNDLHKGRDSGTAWSLLIDISAILMAAFSVSG